MDRWSPPQTGTDFEMSPILEAARAVPPAPDDRLGPAQQAGRNARAARLHRDDVAELRQAVGARRRRPGRRRHAPTSWRRGTSARTRALPSLELTTALRRRAAGVAHADAVAAAGRQPARGVPEAVRPGRHRRRNAPRSCSETGSILDRVQAQARAPAGQPRRARPRRRQRLPRLGARDRAPRADGVAAGHVSARHSRRAGRHAERHHRALQADVRSDGAGVPGGHHARHHVLDGSRSEHAHVHEPRHRRRRSIRSRITGTIPRSRTSWCRSRRYHTEVFAKFIERLAKAPGRRRHACSITRRSSSAAT